EQMLGLLARQGDNPRYLAHFANSLLTHKRVQEAEHYQAQLEKLQPGAFSTLRLKALVLKARGKAAEAVPFLTAFARADAARLAPVARVLEQLGQAKAAEELYSKLVS